MQKGDQINDSIPRPNEKEEVLAMNLPSEALSRKSQYTRPNCNVGSRNNFSCAAIAPATQRRPQINERVEGTKMYLNTKEKLQVDASYFYSSNRMVAEDVDNDRHGDLNTDFSSSEIVASTKPMVLSKAENQPINRTMHRPMDRRPLNVQKQYSETLEARLRAEKDIEKYEFGSALYKNDPDVIKKGFKLGRKTFSMTEDEDF
jgi:hypothetical protein